MIDDQKPDEVILSIDCQRYAVVVDHEKGRQNICHVSTNKH